MLISFVISMLILLFIYPLIIYPFILFVLDKLIGKEPLKNIAFQPEITVLIAAYNEEAMIKDAVDSVLNSNYPKEKIKIIVGSDGSSDRTCEIVQEMMKDYPQLELLEFGRMGKNKVMNHLFAAAKSDFIYVLDADLRFAPDTISNSISLMTDEEIGCVMMNIKSISEAELINHNSGGMGEGFYHRFEQYFREKESRIKTTVNVIGTYLIRKNEQVPLPNSAVCDDLYTVLQVSVNGKRAVFSKESVVYDIRPKQSGEEMKRRARMAAGQLAVCAAIPSLFNPFKGWVPLFFISHKFFYKN